MIGGSATIRLVISCGCILMTSSAALAECEDLERNFQKAVAAKSIDVARSAASEIGSDIVCGERADEFQGKLVEFLIRLAGENTTSNAVREKALEAAKASLDISGNWRTAEMLANYYAGRKEAGAALIWYEKALSFVVSRPSTPASANDKSRLGQRAGAAKSLANNDNEGTKQLAYAASTRDIDGHVGGIYSRELLRGVEVLPIPVPINFFTNETRLTPEGEKAAQELAAVAMEQGVRRMKLVGHADPRGSDALNMDLSKRRVERVRDFLLGNGVKAQIVVEWKGARQPFDESVLAASVSQDEKWALDRRVEWIRDVNDN